MSNANVQREFVAAALNECTYRCVMLRSHRRSRILDCEDDCMAGVNLAIKLANVQFEKK